MNPQNISNIGMPMNVSLQKNMVDYKNIGADSQILNPSPLIQLDEAKTINEQALNQN